MAYDNFKEKVWAKGIQKELERLHIFADGVNKEYTGVIKNLGDTVRIKNVGKPTITTDVFDSKSRHLVLSDPETVSDSAVSLVVDHRSTFNFTVDDIDEAQGANGVMDALKGETSEGLADEQDKFIADLAKGKVGVQSYNAKVNSGNVVTLTANNLFQVVDLAQQLLFENDVKASTPLDLFIPPWVNTLFRQSFIKADTDNSEVLKNGKVGMYGSINLKMSNNVATDANGNYYLQLRTNRAVAFVEQTTHIEPYRPEKGFQDALKGFNLWGGKIVRPKEFLTIVVKPDSN
jgi:hypothetical protein